MTANDVENKPITTEAKTKGCRVFGSEKFATIPEGGAKAGISSASVLFMVVVLSIEKE